MANDTDTDNFKWLGLEAPRYTSYPSAHHFSNQTGKTEHAEWLAKIGNETTISVYVHIPFCNELCWFCGCHTKVTKRYEPIEKYVAVLLKEIENLKQHLGGKGRLVNIHFGGGSPSLLERKDLQAIIDAINSCFAVGSLNEFAIELDPRTTKPENVELYAELGVNRISLGLQDFDPIVQKAINRVQPYKMVAGVMDDLRKNGLNHINCDLIYGLPFQTAKSFQDTLQKTVDLNPDRIALFSYAHVPQVKKHQNMIAIETLPSEQEKLALYLQACEFLAENGYVSIGIDHFAKADDQLAITMQNHTMKRNFQGYVTDTTDVIIGIGSSAISQFPQGYVQNNANTAAYKKSVEEGDLPSVRGWKFQNDDILRKQIIDELMCYMFVDLAEIRQKYVLPENYFESEIKELSQENFRKIAEANGNLVRVTTPYKMAVRMIASVFDKYRTAEAGKYSKVA